MSCYLLIACRPPIASCLTLAQFICWYRPQRAVEEGSQIVHHQDNIPVVTPSDLPPPANFRFLPTSMELSNGVTVRKTKKPSVLDWAPRNDTFSRLMLFQVVCFWLESSHSFDPRHGVQLRISLRSEIPWWLQRKPKRRMPVVEDRRHD